jgi:large subunit ribosomal protein L4
MSLITYSKDGKKSGTVKVPKFASDATLRADLVHQVALSYLANLRRSTAHTKTRGEVRGGGRKPWRQKGTGRARAGSIRSPLWRGGGTIFGPRKVRNFQKRIPASMRDRAFSQVLAGKIRDHEVFVVTTLDLPKPKTKLFEVALHKLPLKEGRILVIIASPVPELMRAAHNVPYITVKTGHTVNVLDLLVADSVIITKEALAVLEERYG